MVRSRGIDRYQITSGRLRPCNPDEFAGDVGVWQHDRYRSAIVVDKENVFGGAVGDRCST